jgi:hypothetical protein
MFVGGAKGLYANGGGEGGGGMGATGWVGCVERAGGWFDNSKGEAVGRSFDDITRRRKYASSPVST